MTSFFSTPTAYPFTTSSAHDQKAKRWENRTYGFVNIPNVKVWQELSCLVRVTYVLERVGSVLSSLSEENLVASRVLSTTSAQALSKRRRVKGANLVDELGHIVH